MKPRGGFQARGRGALIRRGIGSPVKRGGIQVNRFQFNSSSSTDLSSDINSDIPMVNEAPKKKPLALLSSESYYYSDQENDVENVSITNINNQANWHPKPTNVIKRTADNKNVDDSDSKIQNPHDNHTIKNRHVDSNPNLNDDQTPNNTINPNNSFQSPNESQAPNNTINTNYSLPNLNESQAPNNTINTNYSLPNLNESQAPNNVIIANNSFPNLNGGQTPNPVVQNTINMNSSSNIIQATESKTSPISKDDYLSLTIVHEKSSIRRKESFKMLKKNRVIYHTAESKDNISNFTIISTNISCILEGPGYSGFVRHNPKGTKHLLISNEKKLHDDREGELCGIFFKSSNIGKNKMKIANIAIRMDGKPYFSISKRLSLTSIASCETEVQKDMKVFTSTPPESIEQWKQSNDSGEIHMMPSSKNIMICDDNGENIFVFYKIGEGSYRVRIAPPISSLVAFSICISILKAF